MNLHRLLLTGALILALFSCVSKKKYVELQTVLADTESKVKTLSNDLDSVSWLMSQKDTLIDSLSTAVAKCEKKTNNFKPAYKERKSTLSIEEEYYKKVRYVYNFTRFISWPDKKGDFLIGVAGGGNLLDQLNKYMLGKTVGSRNIVVQAFKPGIAFDIVYVSNAKTEGFDYYRKEASKYKSIVISDEDAMISKGAHIGFLIDRSNIMYKADRAGIEKLGLKAGKELMNYSK